MALVITRLEEIPLVQEGDDLAECIVAGLNKTNLALCSGDIIAVAQKIVSKAEGRTVRLSATTPSQKALELATLSGKDPRLVEIILKESAEVLRVGRRLIITKHRLGLVCPNSGVDQANVSVENVAGNDVALLLPVSPDSSARRIRERLSMGTDIQVGVIIVDSHGRPFRRGSIGVCIGISGIPSLADFRGQKDLFGRTRRGAVVGVADELASAASLLMGQNAEGYPIVHIRGFPYTLSEGELKNIVRPVEEDLFY